jgi:asparagine synthase (glutamine-hydrolysing)
VKDGFEDDLPYAKKVAVHLNVELDILKVTPDITQLLPKMIYHLDELQADPAPINVLLICEQAKKQGVKVLLSGAGGDDVFTGYRRHYAVKAEKYWAWLPKPARSLLKSATTLLPKFHSGVISERIE